MKGILLAVAAWLVWRLVLTWIEMREWERERRHHDD